MKFKQTIIDGIEKVRRHEIFKKYATQENIESIWSQYLTEHIKLEKYENVNVYPCIRATLALLALMDEEINIESVLKGINYGKKINDIDLIKYYSKSLIEIKKGCYNEAFCTICFIAYITASKENFDGSFDKLNFDVFEDFKAILLCSENQGQFTIKNELVDALLYCDEFASVYGYNDDIVLEIMEDIVDDSVTDFIEYDDYIFTGLHEEAHRFLEDYLAECTIPFRHDALTENNYEVLVIRLANLIKQNGFAWLMEHVELEDGYYKVDREKKYRGYVGTVLFKGVHYDFDTDSNDIVARQGNIKGEFSVSGDIIDMISDYYEAEYKN